MDQGYPEFGMHLNKTGRPIVYSCSWPAYQNNPDYKSIAEHCNLWRNWADIADSWDSVTKIIKWFADHQDQYTAVAGPGNWNDPDMIIVGNFGLSHDQSRVQMAVWAIMAAPLIMSNDLRTLKQADRDLLLNKHVIKIDQDPLGIPGKRVRIENVRICSLDQFQQVFYSSLASHLEQYAHLCSSRHAHFPGQHLSCCGFGQPVSYGQWILDQFHSSLNRSLSFQRLYGERGL